MKKSLIALAATAVASLGALPRARTHDIAFTYRMGAGFAGDVNRTHPASIYPAMLDTVAPPRFYGTPVLYKTTNNSVRAFTVADASDGTAVACNGVLVRPWPVQAGSAAGNYGQQALTDATPVVTGIPNDILTRGRIMVQVSGAAPGSLTIDSDVYVFCSADEAGHVLGGFETAFIAGKTVKLTNAKYRGPADASGITELEIFA